MTGDLVRPDSVCATAALLANGFGKKLARLGVCYRRADKRADT